MTDTATVFWYPPIDNPIPGSKVIQGKERMFESVENAVAFLDGRPIRVLQPSAT